MTGGSASYKQRGIIPRSISYLFDTISDKSDRFFEISISYMEIYNGTGYDLLDENH